MTDQQMVFVGTTARHAKPEYSLSELATEGFITFQTRSIVHQELQDLLHAEGLAQCRVDTVSSVLVMLRLVEDGAGVATLPRLLVERANNSRLRILRCSTELNPIPLWLSWRKQRNSRSVSVAMDLLQAVLDESIPSERRSRTKPTRR